MIKTLNTTQYDDLVAFLPCRTPDAWVHEALQQLPTLLIDHAHCEKKAASTALTMMYRYVMHYDLLQKMSRLAREELRHFEQVLAIMTRRGIQYDHLTCSRYAGGLAKIARTYEPERLIDRLIMGAFIEARSCERFLSLIPHLDIELAEFYSSLLKSEARHYQDYLHLARTISDSDLDTRIADFALVEKALIESPDIEFRFHSGPPVESADKT